MSKRKRHVELKPELDQKVHKLAVKLNVTPQEILHRGAILVTEALIDMLNRNAWGLAIVDPQDRVLTRIVRIREEGESHVAHDQLRS